MVDERLDASEGSVTPRTRDGERVAAADGVLKALHGFRRKRCLLAAPVAFGNSARCLSWQADGRSSQ